MSRLIVIGAGGHGKVVADCAQAIAKDTEIVFLDERYPQITQLGPWPIVGSTQNLAKYIVDDCAFFVAIGGNLVRQNVTESILQQHSLPLATLVHPSATISPHAAIGDGTLVCANAVINPMAKVGRGCIINTAATVDHDNQIGDYCHISVGSHLAGTVCIGSGSFIGIGSVISNNLTVGENCTVGAGATVITDILDNQTVVGTPAKPIIKTI